MSSPAGVAADPSGRVYGSDANNNRVLVFNDAVNRPDGVAADNVLGQPNFATSLSAVAGSTSMYAPTGLYFDSAANALWVGEYDQARAIRFSPFSALLDVDASGKWTRFDALTDGLPILRYLFGLRNAALTTSAVAANATRNTSAAIEAYIQSLMQ